MKTKKFLLCTSGTTVDGREINAEWLRQMAEDYNPKTYGARLNIEHVRGVTGQQPFRAFGDVLELSVEDNYEITVGGETEKRTALFGVFDVTEEAKSLNEQGQKVYPSVEIDPDFAGKGRAYMMGCALTDSPAAIGTQRLSFNRVAPGHDQLKQQELGGLLEFAEEEPQGDVAGAIESGFARLFKKIGLIGGEPEKPKPEPKPAEGQQVDLSALMEGVGGVVAQALATQQQKTDADIAALSAQMEQLSSTIENTEEPGHRPRPAAAGTSDGMDYSKAF
ncbi:GPO family capsid scaffolding protein [Altericroceibacterium endophyticum]|uniref:Phage capsid protein n=1 Tax=Altericroceibacterium endophyticum TaxID=1808508 RepID=A0A6I4T550_9SPHN|nr:GPO family capsid scaffolding protein [Altericroceibacterium endophyticum]MXO64835.1 hypothetical protein [Altericroceibacterium endophyticum]